MAWEFIKKAAMLPIELLDDVVYIMGNESCDLDSAASAIAYAFIRNRMVVVKHDIGISIPILNIPNEDLALKTEVCYYLKKCGVPMEYLFFRDRINRHALTSGKFRVVLVDHHALSEQDACLAPNVIEVFDHRPLDPDWKWENVQRTMETVGSCATLIAELAIHQNDFHVPQEVLMLLYGTIILDTSCLSEPPKKFTPKDVAVLKELEKRLLCKPSRDAVYKELLSARCDISQLTVSQLLRKDTKVVCHMLISSIPILLQDFLSMPNAEEEIVMVCDTYKYSAVVMLGVSKIDNELKRELAVFSREQNRLKKLADALEKAQNPNLQLQYTNKFSDSVKVILFEQLNTNASRKQILPLVKQFFVDHKKANYSSSGSSVDEDSTADEDSSQS